MKYIYRGLKAKIYEIGIDCYEIVTSQYVERYSMQELKALLKKGLLIRYK